MNPNIKMSTLKDKIIEKAKTPEENSRKSSKKIKKVKKEEKKYEKKKK